LYPIRFQYEEFNKSDKSKFEDDLIYFLSEDHGGLCALRSTIFTLALYILSFCCDSSKVTLLIYICVGAHRWGRRNALGKEAVAKIIDDTYRYNFSYLPLQPSF
jgi:hypothetical protein